MVALLESLSSQSVPAVLFPDSLRGLERDIQISALYRKVKPSVLVLDEMQGNLGIALLLQVCNDALSHEIAGPDNVQHFVVVVADERELEAVLGRIDRDCLRLRRAIEAMDRLALDTRQVDRLIKSLYNAIVAANSEISREQSAKGINRLPLRKRVFDVVQGRVDQDAGVIPRSRLDPDRLVNKTALGKHFVGNHDGCQRASTLAYCCSVSARLTVLAEQGNQVAIVIPDSILDRRGRKLGEHFLLLNVVEHNRRAGREQ